MTLLTEDMINNKELLSVWMTMGRTILHQKLKGYYDLKITEKMITRQCRELPNWESTGFDEVQGYWHKFVNPYIVV